MGRGSHEVSIRRSAGLILWLKHPLKLCPDLGVKRSRRLMVFVNPFGGTVSQEPIYMLCLFIWSVLEKRGFHFQEED